MRIIVSIRNEKIKLIEGVLSGIPHHCQVIIVSNSDRAPIGGYNIEKDVFEHVCKFIKKKVLIVHQKDPKLREACGKSGYKFLLNDKGEIKNGNAEGMILSAFLAYLGGQKYIGFIDSDNYFPGIIKLDPIFDYSSSQRPTDLFVGQSLDRAASFVKPTSLPSYIN